MSEAKRYLGLELAGAKNQKTSLASLEYYPNERKVFVLDIFDRISHIENQTGDEALLELIAEVKPGVAKMGVNVALELPPCITCTRKSCPLPTQCSVPSVKWMRASHRKGSQPQAFTPYTQRPIELWVRHQLFSKLPETHHFDIDETLGGSRAPLTARMNFLKRHLKGISFVEVWPKLSIAILAHHLKLDKRLVSTYRHLENGAYSREEILISLSKKYEIFIYERDMRKLSQNLNSFDAFICAFTALLSDENQCVKTPKGFPEKSGWVQYPKMGSES